MSKHRWPTIRALVPGPLLLVFVALSAACASTSSRPSAQTTSSSAPPSTSSAPVTSSAPPPTVSPTPTRKIHVPPIPNGTYEMNATLADARRLGFVQCDPADVNENTGHVKLTLFKGRFQWRISADHPIFHTFFSGVYTGTSKVVTFIFDPNTADVGPATLRWHFDGRFLHLKVIRMLDAEGQPLPPCIYRLTWEAHPWKKTR